MSILVKDMEMPTRCWDCPFYKIAYDDSYCGLTKNDVVRRTPTPRPDDCPLVEVEPVKHGHWIFTQKETWYAEFQCSECGEGVYNKTKFCSNCGAKMDEGEED